uniref:Myosin motor domain-containing protein n=1 Tax=Acrobeloides nanus TaxID=290746 RepID=A0A914BUW0_9BILA
MQSLMFNNQEIWAIFKVLAALLHLGNIKYNSVKTGNTETIAIADQAQIYQVIALLQLDRQIFIDALTKRTLNFPNNENVITNLSHDQAIDVRDGFARAIYDQLFNYIIKKINLSLDSPILKFSSIGLLDIFGFEIFETNSFEQLCINYANEHLQQFFIRHIFQLEHMEYKNEDIVYEDISYYDDESRLKQLNLIGADSISIMSIIDEQTILQQCNDDRLLSELNGFSNNPFYIRNKFNNEFGVKHFAGPVYYKVQGFIEKNRDQLGPNLVGAVKASRLELLLNLFEETNAQNTTDRFKQTVGLKYRKSLKELISNLEKRESFFIRCIKPNEYQKPNNFNHNDILRQLRFFGMLDTIRIRKSGYPIRHSYENFVLRYRVLAPSLGSSEAMNMKEVTKAIYVSGFYKKKKDY